MRRDFQSGGIWRCGEISRAAFIGMSWLTRSIISMAEICGEISRGQDLEVRRDFEETR